jgi:hypothetical protein
MKPEPEPTTGAESVAKGMGLPESPAVAAALAAVQAADTRAGLPPRVAPEVCVFSVRVGLVSGQYYLGML